MPSEHDVAFPRLSRPQIDALRRWGQVQSVAPGDVLFKEGDRGFSFFVVLEGAVVLDKKGFVLTGSTLPPETGRGDLWRAQGRTPFFLETSLPGVFAAGDVRSGSVKRCASAVGEGAMAVSFIHASLEAASLAKGASTPAA